MYMLPQILNISTENFIINQIISNLKSKLSELLDEFIIDNSKNRYVDLCQVLGHFFLHILYFRI